MQAASDGGPLAAITQNKKAMIGIGVAAVLAIIILIVQMVSSMAPPPAAEAPPDGLNAAAEAPGGIPGSEPGIALPPGEGGAPAGAPTDPAMAGGFPGGAPAGVAPAAPGAAPTGEKAKKQPPGVPVRTNPFAPNKELADVLGSIPATPQAPEAVSPKHDIYAELYEPPPSVQISDDENEGPPVPQMRVTGIILGTQVSALMQIGSEFLQVTPGKWLPNENNPIYRVERIEQGKVILTRKWEEGNRKGIQRIEVGISGASGGGTGGAPGGFRPGMVPGMGMPGGSPTI